MVLSGTKGGSISHAPQRGCEGFIIRGAQLLDLGPDPGPFPAEGTKGKAAKVCTDSAINESKVMWY